MLPYLMSSRMAFSDCSTSSALAGCSGPLYPPNRSRIHPPAGRPTASAAAPASNGGLDVTCMQSRPWLSTRNLPWRTAGLGNRHYTKLFQVVYGNNLTFRGRVSRARQTEKGSVCPMGY